MSDRNHHKALKNGVKRHAARRQKAERERHSVLAEVSFLGVLGLVFVLPMIGGAYLGRWLDAMGEGYSLRWTLGLLLLGLIVGMMNVYFMLRGRE